MRVCRSGEIILPCFQNVSTSAEFVVGAHLFAADLYFHRFACAGGKFLCFIEPDELNGGLFHLIFYVVSRIGRLHIELNDFLAGHFAAVFDRYFKGKQVVSFVITAGKSAPLEPGIGETVAEGICHNAFVVITASVALL